MKKSFLFVFLAIATLVQAQEQEQALPKKYNLEIGLNITRLLASVLATNSNSILVNDPYTFLLKNKIKNNYLRIGLYGNFDIKKEVFDFNGDRTSKINKIGTRIGIEYRNQIMNHFELFYGADLIYVYDKEKVIFNDFSGITSQTITIFNKFGAGPIVGLNYKFAKRLMLSTESSIYIIGGQETDKLLNNNVLVKSDKKDVFNITHLVPSSLSIYLKF
ncbi:MAG: hypothetical protein ABIO44_09330 [Saprospiraceae bacterium]